MLPCRSGKLHGILTVLESGTGAAEPVLRDIADELSVSESAASQRLNAAETKLITSFLDA